MFCKIADLYEEKVHARDRYLEPIRQHEEKTWKLHARACFEADYDSPDVHPGVHPPLDLLTGPWDEEKRRLLFWLVRAGAC
ncbi:hypothetical protein E4U26_007601, partial [Claviceps purpurea]